LAAPAPRAPLRHPLRHWKQRFDPKADFIWTAAIPIGDRDPKTGELPRSVPGEPVDKERFGKKLAALWVARKIALAVWPPPPRGARVVAAAAAAAPAAASDSDTPPAPPAPKKAKARARAEGSPGPEGDEGEPAPDAGR
jgi:hypothetical protein